MTKIKATILALRIEYHWRCIKQCRRKFDVLSANGFLLESPQIQKLNARAGKHTVRVMVYDKTYRAQYSKLFDGVLF